MVINTSNEQASNFHLHKSQLIGKLQQVKFPPLICMQVSKNLSSEGATSWITTTGMSNICE